MWSEVRGTLEHRLRTDPGVAAVLPEVEDDVTAGRITPSTGAHRLLDRLGLGGGA